jgi:drug/metabolite transporter (DMT)-like permease
MNAGILFGLGAALSWGAADFLARYSSRRIGAYRTLFFMQLTGLVAASLYLAGARGAPAALWHGLASHWALAAFLGAITSVNMMAFYLALERGTLSIVAPISSSFPALTVFLAYVSGERLTRMRLAGAACALAGVILASMVQGAAPTTTRGSQGWHAALGPGVLFAILASLGFGIWNWVIGFYAVPAWGGAATVWIQRLATILWLAVALVASRRTIALPQFNAYWLVGSVGVLDALGFLLVNLGFAREQVGVVTVLSSLFGAVTLLLALVVLRERLSSRQWLGVALIFAGILLINSPVR